MHVKVSYGNIEILPLSPTEFGDDTLGIYDQSKHTILIRHDLPPSKQASVLIHELIHACFDLHALRREKLTEEDVCEMLDGPITALLTDNGTLSRDLNDAIHFNIPIVRSEP